MMMRILATVPDIEDEESLEVFVLDRSIALTLLISLVGFFSCAFFLSRSYNILLYLIAAFVVAHFSGVRDRFPGIQGFPVRQGILLWPTVGALAVVGFYIVVKVLLAMA
jgi:putative inorganic carbon (HCO3(-)) transporter